MLANPLSCDRYAVLARFTCSQFFAAALAKMNNFNTRKLLIILILKTGIKSFVDNTIKIAFSWCYRMSVTKIMLKYKFTNF